MTTLEKLMKKRAEVLNLNAKLHETGNENEFLNKKVNELLTEEWDLRYKCAEQGIDHNQVK